MLVRIVEGYRADDGLGRQIAPADRRRSASAALTVRQILLAGRGLFSLEGCGSAAAGEGEWNVRLRDPDVSWASFYAIAADPAARPALLALERRLPRACGNDASGRGGDRRWLESLADLAGEPSVVLAWNGLRVAVPARGDSP